MFRSEPMSYYQLYLQPEATFYCISQLGHLGLVEFVDLNRGVNSFQRKFVDEIRRCDNMQRQLAYFLTELHRDGLSVPPAAGESLDEVDLQPRDTLDLQAQFDHLETQLNEVISHASRLDNDLRELYEMKFVLCKTQSFFDASCDSLSSASDENIFGRSYDTPHFTREEVQALLPSSLHFITGVVHISRLPALEKMLWRVCHGKALLRHSRIDTISCPLLSESLANATVFVVSLQGHTLRDKVLKVCRAFHATIYMVPDALHEREQLRSGLLVRIQEITEVVEKTREHRARLLAQAVASLRLWTHKVLRLKHVYHVLNMLSVDTTRHAVIAECWLPATCQQTVFEALCRGCRLAASQVPPVMQHVPAVQHLSAPTYLPVNRFTRAFQTLVDAYGVPSYRELNPAVFSIITFPFLFAVMFGDFGHGLLLVLCSLALIIHEARWMKRRITNEIFSILFAGRYIILLMGLFSMYTGVIYNDAFSKSMNVFGSAWRVGLNASAHSVDQWRMLPPDSSSCYRGTPYYFGVDPVWQASANSVTFRNAFKMKLSILLGVLHMIVGIGVSGANYVLDETRATTRKLWTTFLPQLLFLLALFGWLCAMCVIKWLLFSAANSHCAPSILILFIDMFMFRSATATSEHCTSGGYLFVGQRELQMALVAVALVCVPWMLLCEPLVVYCQQRRLAVAGGRRDRRAVASCAAVSQLDWSDICVNQLIHTIEFALGTISHTSSYLRLWALSLAHSQLSKVLWSMVLVNGLGTVSPFSGGGFVLFAVFAVWAGLTVAILLIMESLSAFLHTLRLHWVEFQSKFYCGQGVKFQPFVFMQPDLDLELMLT